MSAKATVTATLLNLRSGPGTEFAVLRQLARGTEVEVLAREGSWLKLQLNGTTGYAHKNFVFVPETEAPRGFLREREELRTVPLPASESESISLPRRASPEEKLVAETWNACGGLLGALSREVRIQAGAGVAVLCVESSGKGFGADGRLKIRFENHIFWQRWGRQSEQNSRMFERHFRFDAQKKWQKHEFRAATGEPWTPVHRSQSSEWEALALARKLDEAHALCSISMGAPQLMGFNFASAGYQTVQEMFAAFSHAQSGERDQILGLFDFIKGPGEASPMIAALQRRDFVAFAGRYNGPGQAIVYAERIEKHFEMFERLRGG